MKTEYNTMVVVADTRTKLEKKIVDEFHKGHEPLSDVIEADGQFQIELTN